MDAFIKVRRNRNYDEEKVEQKEALESGQSSCHPEEKQVWPLNLSSEALPSSSLKKERFDDLASFGSSGYFPSSSSCDGQSIYSSTLSSSGDSISCDELEESIKRAQYQPGFYPASAALPSLERPTGYVPSTHGVHESIVTVDQQRKPAAVRGIKPPLLAIGPDPMAQVLTFLEPAEILKVLTMPICKEWRQSYTSHQDLWRVLCLLDPFKADVGDGFDDSSSDDSDSFCSLNYDPEVNNILGKYRLMYTSFVRCMKYLTRLKEDTRNGKAPSAIDYGRSGFPHFGVGKGLKKFLARKQGVLKGGVAADVEVSSAPIGVSDAGYSSDGASRKRPASQDGVPSKKAKFGKSMLTGRLLGPSMDGAPSHLNLPQSCGIFSIVNWMVAYPDVEGIQTMCVEALPCLLEDEHQRMTAQWAGLLEVVLQAMLRFANSLKLHTAAFHTMVLLARPLGGREGMLFDNSMAESSASLEVMTSTSSSASASAGAASLGRSGGPRLNGMNGIAIMMDSMRRFECEEKLQAMACWAMVNLALVPAQKTMLISLDGIQATINAMLRHPHCFDVQFRALFALINLVVPCKFPKPLHPGVNGAKGRTEKDVLDENVGAIVNLVVVAMKNFCSCETMLNRACLVLHNLSQNPEYLTSLLWTPHCFQVLEWCIANYPTDQVLRRSAVSTLHRLQVLLTANESLRARFAKSILRSEQELSLNAVGEQEQIL